MKMRGGMGLVLWGLAVLLLSCEDEGSLEGSGEKVRVNISLEDVVYKGNETVTRGDYSGAETVRVHLGNGMYMDATIEEDVETPMRADALDNGVKVRVVAYVGATSTIASTTEYTVVNGALTTETALEVDAGTAYKFVGYSYNSGVSPDYPASSATTITVASPHDLIWGESGVETITAVNNSVSITMNHKFAQVRVKATTTGITSKPNITNMTGVTITPGNAVDLTIQTGGVAQNPAAAVQVISSWGAFNLTTVVSQPITVNTGTANPIYVNIGSVTIAGYSPFPDLLATFNKALVAGQSYTLVVSFQEMIFVGSNIYWVSTGGNDGYLTFDKGTSGHETYQGVFFRWGSLVGISPNGGNGTRYTLDNTVPIYKPTSATTFTKTAVASMADIPYITPPNTAYDGNYVLAQGNNWSAGTGDICNFIDENYRLPKWGEFGLGNTSYVSYSWDSSNPNTTPITGGWSRFGDDWSSITATNDEGTFPLISGASIHGTVLPASGWRLGNDGSLSNLFTPLTPGKEGFYWSGSSAGLVSGTPMPYALVLYFSNIHCGTYGVNALPVRCVRN
jgi:hypothetical protein